MSPLYITLVYYMLVSIISADLLFVMSMFMVAAHNFHAWKEEVLLVVLSEKLIVHLNLKKKQAG